MKCFSCCDKITSKLAETRNNSIEKDGVLATKLCTHKDNVDHINELHLSKITGKSQVYQAVDSDSSQSQVISRLVPVAERIELKIGAQVTGFHKTSICIPEPNSQYNNIISENFAIPRCGKYMSLE